MPVEQVVVTDTLALPAGASSKIKQLSVAGLVASIVEADVQNNQGAFGLIADINESEDDFEEAE